MEQHDENKDGKVSLEERIKVASENFPPDVSLTEHNRKLLVDQFNHFDLDGNGFIERHEVQAFFNKQMLENMRAGMQFRLNDLFKASEYNFKVNDKNGDGFLDKEEFATYFEGMNADNNLGIKGYFTDVGLENTTFEDFDKDGDGKISLEELTELELCVFRRKILREKAEEWNL